MKLIVEMEMPKNCCECEANYDCAFCGITGSAFYGNTQMPNFMPDEQKLPDCPIKGVLPDEHGDLIDRDALIEDINKQVRMLDAFGIEELRLIGKEMQKGMIAEIDKQTSVIAAERKDDGTAVD